jgi:shikimate kinase
MTEIAHEKKNLIYLTGFMGSGKSTIGPILANTLGYDFVDVDKLVVERVGKSVKEIFQDEGEKYFRTIEWNIIQEVSRCKERVISLGGGTMMDPRNFALVKESGVLVYLYSSPEHLLQRLRNKTDRPVLSNSEGERLELPQLRERIFQLYAARAPIYSQAHIIIDTDERKVGKTVDDIVKQLSGMLE